MAQVIADVYSTLIAEKIEEPMDALEFDHSKIVLNVESGTVEFKSTLRTNLHTGEKDPRMELAVLKTIAGFLNTNGGILIIGLTDEGTPVDIQADDFTNEDKMSLHLVNIVKSRMGIQAMTSHHAHFDDHEDIRVMFIKCKKSSIPISL